MKIIFKQKIFVLGLFLTFIFLLSGCANFYIPDFYKQNINEDENYSVQAGQVAVIKNDIIINKPLSGEIISSPLVVSGKIMIDVDEIYFRLIDEWDNLVATSSVKLQNNNQEYSLQMEFPVTFTQQGVLQAYLLSEDKKSEMDLIKVPVQFKDYKKPVMSLFYSNIYKDPDLKKCGEVYPLEKEVVIKNDFATSVLFALFSTLSEEEMKNGYVNNFPEGEIKINKVESIDGIVNLDFSAEILEGVEGACRKEAMVAQITETIKQFKDVKVVKITVEGKDIK